MADIQFFHSFVDELSKGGHNLQADTFKIALTNTAPSLATQQVWNTTNAPAPAAANGYSAGGQTAVVASAATTGGEFKLVLQDMTFTASGGSIGPFRYAWLYNASKGNKAVGVWDNGSSITLADGDTTTVDFDPGSGVMTLSL